MLKAKDPSLGGEDIEEILERTARDADIAGRDNATGWGAIDAGAAVNYLQTKNFLRSRSKVTVQSNSAVSGKTNVNMHGYWSIGNQYWASVAPVAKGELRRITARVNFSQSFVSAPDVWLRWAQSDGIDPTTVSVTTIVNSVAYTGLSNFLDSFEKGSRITSVDTQGMVVEAYFWKLTFYNTAGQLLGYVNYPEPTNLFVAYTAAGLFGTPALGASISGPSSRALNVSGTWTASVSGGTPPYSYSWQYLVTCPGGPNSTDNPDSGIAPNAENCGMWTNGGTGSSFTKTIGTNSTLQLKLSVTDSSNPVQTRAVSKNVMIGMGSAMASNQGKYGSTLQAQSLRELPIEYSLTQNYPNPFNPLTEIRFLLPETRHVTLVVYDVMGREVVRLLNEEISAGIHEVTFDGSDLPSGVYLYQLEAGEFVQSRRMTLLK